MAQSVSDGGICQAVDPESGDRLLDVEIIHDITEDGLPLPGTIGSAYNLIGILKEVLDDSELLHYTRIILIGLTFLLLPWNHNKLLGQHWKVALRPTVIAVVLWHRQLYQMTKGVGHLPAVTLVEAILLLGGSYDSGNALGNTGLLC